MKEYLVLEEFKHGRKTYKPGEMVKLWPATAQTRADAGFVEILPDEVGPEVVPEDDKLRFFLSRDITTDPPPAEFGNWHYPALKAYICEHHGFDPDKEVQFEKTRGADGKVDGWNCTQ